MAFMGALRFSLKSLGDGRKTPGNHGEHRKTKVENPWFPGENMNMI